MLYHLGAGDEIVATGEQLGLVGIELVVTRHIKARLPPHGDEGRPGTAAKIEATGRRAHPGEYFTEGAHQKTAITGIVHPVVVPVIDRLLGRIVQMIRLIQPDQIARQTTVIAFARHRQGVTVASRAEGAADA
ncbi:hypothetical protein D3C84_842140 [compost metagenome]